ncbi:Outer membrane receptor proteins, mostly Fe transport [Lutibacter agarilyticus]|uniref:Outer membrane receptor proteins, mostly Fe transport n=1 Tax=Lutibacter agarilyticus TaxID=1109740 RepID=A0A238VCU0_9FLAO|nr:carboxypeptidase-like regulatory domain-containing protein [Lutibacter agarilyticus]SNR32220.1 Outer membrane receptor proteins, mostly Fe transport [Lutibacter agarilyticus]
MKNYILSALLLFTTLLTAQNAIIKGVLKNEFKEPIEGVAVTSSKYGTVTNNKGEYTLTVAADIEITVIFTHVSYKTFQKKVKIPKNKTFRFSPTLTSKVEEMNEVVIENSKREAQGIINVDPLKATKIPGAKEGVENILLTLAGVNNNNELSTQYNVRGGNFDENLVYINGIEVYRPFLVRTGQQEGLSFVNENLAQNVNFSAGGFQAKYGDKLSSVLDITYRTPDEFAANISASLLGASATVEGTLFDKKLSVLLGARYRNNSLLINSKDIETNAEPNFTDVQLFLSYLINEKFKIDFLGVYSLNNYNYTPKSRSTKFGTISDPLELIVFYEGQEKDAFQTLFGAVNGTYSVNKHLKLGLTTSVYHTVEQEHYDIFATYNLGEVNADFGSDNFGEVAFSEGIGSQLNHGRNDLDALISAVEFKGTYKKNNHQIDFGIKYKNEDIRDRIKEWEVIDSVGFSVRPPHHSSNNQPYEPYTSPIEPYQNVQAQNNVKIDRLVWFAQYSKNAFINNHKIWYNVGLRSHNWNVNGEDITTANQITYSLRGQFAIKPDWEKDMLFRISGGMYHQPPFYKELRNFEGNVVPTVDAQKSLQVVLGNDYSFNLWSRPFKLVTELYYKSLSDVNIYTVDNVRIRYIANNNATAYATGLDLRLNGEFVPGTESWISIGFLKTEENYNNQGYIARPTDQRFKFGMLFQDYMPNIPNVRMYLNLVYNTGVPGGAPSYTNPYDYQNRLNDYKRADIGVSYVFTDAKNQKNSGWLKNFKELSIGAEIYNLFDVQNSITNTWVRDAYSKQYYAIPNYMTPRVFNVKMQMKF